MINKRIEIDLESYNTNHIIITHQILEDNNIDEISYWKVLHKVDKYNLDCGLIHNELLNLVFCGDFQDKYDEFYLILIGNQHIKNLVFTNLIQITIPHPNIIIEKIIGNINNEKILNYRLIFNTTSTQILFEFPTTGTIFYYVN